jgi:predicted ATP-grasp superfamily ATP-dependent carboligase
MRHSLEKLGSVLTVAAGLLGLFGVDLVIRNGVPYPVEVNPRYTASMEIVELGCGLPVMTLHRKAFDQRSVLATITMPPTSGGKIGKAILFAKKPLVFPGDGPWSAAIRRPRPVGELPDFADIPIAGESIRQGSPVLTLFARAATVAACLDSLREIAGDLDHWLYRS